MHTSTSRNIKPPEGQRSPASVKRALRSRHMHTLATDEERIRKQREKKIKKTEEALWLRQMETEIAAWPTKHLDLRVVPRVSVKLIFLRGQL